MGQRVRKVIESQTGVRRKERLYLGGFEIYREYDANGSSINLERESLHVLDDKQRIALVETQTIADGSPVSAPDPVQRHQLGNHLGSASLLFRQFKIGGKTIEFLGEVGIKGRQLTLGDIAVFPQGADAVNQLGPAAVRSIFRSIAQEAKSPSNGV